MQNPVRTVDHVRAEAQFLEGWLREIRRPGTDILESLRAAVAGEGARLFFPWFLLGERLMINGDIVRAEQAARRALEIDPRDLNVSGAHHLLARICYRTGRDEEGRRYHAEAILKNPFFEQHPPDAHFDEGPPETEERPLELDLEEALADVDEN